MNKKETLSPGTPDPRDDKEYFFHMTTTRRILTETVRQAFKLIVITHAQGVENLPAHGPVILAANHLTNYDVFPLQFILPRPIFYMGKAELFRNPVLDWLLRQLGGFPVYREQHDEWAKQHARRILQHGLVLGMFPEGKRTHGKGLRPAKTGIARLAQETNSPIVPVAIHGPQHMFYRFPHRTTVEISLAAPIYPQPGETHISITERVMFTIAEMLPEEIRGAYSYRPTNI
ncbi:MAG: lysophospholipid acyltransferase family protein [Chloroflexota bacterium]